MKWYLAKIIYRIICGEGDHCPQFDEQLRLIAANGKEEAFHKAKKMGKEGEDTFINRRNEMVQWQFINVSEINELGELADGTELYSRIEEKDNADAFIYTVNKKAENLSLSKKLHSASMPA